MVSEFSPPLLDILPFVQFLYYKMGDSILEYTETEMDLGILMNHANERFRLLKRTVCHFVHSIEKRRVFYLTSRVKTFTNSMIIYYYI